MKLVCKFDDDEQRTRLAEFLKAKAGALGELGATCKGVLLERHDEPGLFVPSDRSKTETIVGTDSIEERLLGNTFIVPINSFFQVHTGLAEMLYSRVARLGETKSRSASCSRSTRTRWCWTFAQAQGQLGCRSASRRAKLFSSSASPLPAK